MYSFMNQILISTYRGTKASNVVCVLYCTSFLFVWIISGNLIIKACFFLKWHTYLNPGLFVVNPVMFKVQISFLLLLNQWERMFKSDMLRKCQSQVLWIKEFKFMDIFVIQFSKDFYRTLKMIYIVHMYPDNFMFSNQWTYSFFFFFFF